MSPVFKLNKGLCTFIIIFSLLFSLIVKIEITDCGPLDICVVAHKWTIAYWLTASARECFPPYDATVTSPLWLERSALV